MYTLKIVLWKSFRKGGDDHARRETVKNWAPSSKIISWQSFLSSLSLCLLDAKRRFTPCLDMYYLNFPFISRLFFPWELVEDGQSLKKEAATLSKVFEAQTD